MKRTLFVGILILLISCSKNKLEKKGFSVTSENEISSSETTIKTKMDTLEFRTRPKNVLLTNNSKHRLSTIYKINYDKKNKHFFTGSNYHHGNYIGYYERKGNQWNGNFMPGFEAIYGYNMVNISHFNIEKKTKNDFFEKPVLVKTLYYPTYSRDTLNFKPISRNYYMVSVYNEDTNKDGFINVNDLRRFYFFDIEGKNKTYLIPKNYYVMSSEYDPENDYMYIYAKKDENDNGKMEEKEETEIFWIDLKNPKNNGKLY